MSFEYTFPGDESFMVISGAVRIELEDGDAVEPLEKFTVVSG